MQRIASVNARSRLLRRLAVCALICSALLPAAVLADTADSLYQAAQDQDQDGNINDAIANLQKAVAAKPNFADAWAKLGSCYIENGQFAKAVDPYHQAAQLQPDNYAVLLGYQSALEGANLKDAEEPVLRALFKLNPSDPVIGIKYMALLEQLGTRKYPADYADLLETLRKQPNADPSLDVKLGRHYLAFKKYDRAIPVYQELVKKDPESAENWKGLAQALAGNRNIPEAKQAYQKAILYSNSADDRAKLTQTMNALAAVPAEATPASAATKTNNAKTEKAHLDTIAAAQAAQAKSQAAASQAHADSVAAAKAQADSTAQAKAAEQKTRQDSVAAAQAAQAKSQAEAKAAASKAHADSLAAAKTQADSIAQAKAAEQKTRQDSVAAAQAAQAKSQAEAKAAASKAHADSVAAAKTQADSIAQAKAAERKARQDSVAAAQAAQAKSQAEAKVAASKAHADSVASAKAQADSIAQAKAAQQKARQDSVAAAQAAQAKLQAEAKAAAAKAHADSVIAAKAQADSVAQAKARRDSLAQVRADSLAKAKLAASARAQARRDSVAAAKVAEKARQDSIAQAKVAAAAIAKARRDSIATAKAQVAAHVKARRDSLAQVRADSLAKAKLAASARAQARRDSVAAAKVAEKARQDSIAQAKVAAAAVAKARRDSIAAAEAQAAVQAKARRDSLVQVRADSVAKAKLAAAARAQARRDSVAAVKAAEKARQDSIAQAKAVADRKFAQNIDAVLRQAPATFDTAALISEIETRSASGRSKTANPHWIEAEGILNYFEWNYALALQSFQKLKTPSPLASRLMARSYFALQKYPEAARHYARVPDLHDNKVDWGNYARALSESGERAKAAIEYEAYLAKYPDADEALSYLIDYYRKPLRKDKLLPKLEMQLQKTPKDVTLLTEIIGLVDKSSPQAVTYRQQLLALTPDDNRLKYQLAQLQESRGDLKDALPLYEAVAADYTGDKAFNEKLARLMLQAHRPADAVKYLEIAASLDPSNKALQLQLADLYTQNHEVEKAQQAYLKALDLDPKDKAVQDKVLAAFSGAPKDQRRDALLRIDAADPTAHAVEFELAKMALDDSDQGKAYQYLNRALKQQPDNAQYQSLLPAVVTQESEVDDHLPALERLAQQPGTKPELEVLIAKALLARKNAAIAARYLDDVYAKSPKLLAGDKDAVLALHQARKFQASADLAGQYLAANPGDKDMLRVEVEADQALGKGGDTLRQAMQNLVQADPEAGSQYLTRLAGLDLQAHDTAAAVGHLSTLVDREPKSLEGWRLLYALVQGKSDQQDLQIKALEHLWQGDAAGRPRYDRKLADLYFQAGDYDEAGKTLARALAKSPSDASAWYRLGETELKLRKEAAAAEKFAKAYQLQPLNAAYARAYGQTVTKPADLQTTLSLWRFLSQQNPTSEELHKFAQALFLNGNYAESALQWDALVKTDSSLITSEPMVGEAYLKSGQTAKARTVLTLQLQGDPDNLKLLEAMAALDQQTGDRDDYLKTLEHIVQVNPKYKDYVRVLAQEKEKAKDTKGALALYAQWSDQNPHDMAAAESVRRLAEQEQDTTSLLDALTRLSSQKGASHTYQFQIAEIKYDRGGGIAEVARLSRLHPEWKRGKQILVREYLKRGEKAKLAPYLPFLESEARTDTSLLQPLGDLYAMERKNGPANAAYWKWLQANPKTRSVYDKVHQFARSTGSATLGEILRLGSASFPDDDALQREYAASLGNGAAAIPIYQHLIANQGADTALLSKAVSVAVAVHQYPQAQTWIEQWALLSPDNVKVWEQAYAVASAQGNKPNQVKALEKIVALKPDRKDALLHLAQAYEGLGQNDQAAKIYTQLIALDPKNAAVLGKLETLLSGPTHREDLKQVLLQVENAEPKAHQVDYQLARIYLADSNSEKAYVYLSKALKLQPQNSAYLELLPDVVTTDAQAVSYLAILERRAKSPTAKPELKYLVARAYLAKKSPTMAARYLQDVYAAKPDLLVGNRDAILALYGAKKYSAAGSLAAKYVTTHPDDFKIRTVQVECLLAEGKGGAELRTAMEGLVGENPAAGSPYLLRLAALDVQARDSTAALAHAQAFADRNPKSLEAWRLIYSLAQGRAGSEDVYQKALEQLAALDASGRARYDRELSEVYFNRGDYEDAEKILERALKTSPRDAALWFKLGQVENKLLHDAPATEAFAKAYSFNPSNLEYARTYGTSIHTPAGLKATLALWKLLRANNPSVGERRKLAESLFLNGDYPGAATEWNWLVQGDSTLGATEPMVAQSFLRAGQYAKARRIVQMRLQTDSTNLELREGMVTITKQAGNPAEYLQALQALVDINPKYKNYQLLLAQQKEKAKDYKGALDQYDQYVARTSGDPATLEAMRHLADTLQDTARLVEALVRLNREKHTPLPDKFQSAEVDYARGGSLKPLEQLVQRYPTFRDGRLALVKIYLRQGDAEKLKRYTTWIDKLTESDPSWAEAAGDVYAKLKRSKDANAAYVQAVNHDKKNRALFDKAYAYAKKTDSPYRSALLRQGYASFPDDENVEYDYAVSLGNTQPALDLYNKILAKNDQHLPSLRNAAEISMTLGRTDAAVSLLQRWTDLEPNNLRPWTLLADAYRKQRHADKLAEALGRISDLQPKDAEAAGAAADAFRQQGDKGKAIEYYTRAVSLAPQKAEFQKEYGLLLLDAGQTAKAKPPLLQADRRMPRDEAINKGLYDIYQAESDKKSARARMQTLYALKPSNRAYAVSLARLDDELDDPAAAASILSRPELRDTLDASLSFMLLDAYFRTGQRDRAALLGPDLLRRYPSEAKKSLPLAILFYDQHKNQQAREILESYTGENSGPEGFYYLGKIEYAAKDWQHAAQALEHAQNYKPDALPMLADAYVQTGNVSQAITVYENDYSKTKDDQALVKLYGLYKQAKQPDGIVRTLERLLALHGRNLDYRSELAAFYLAGGNAPKAEEQYNLILKQNPEQPEANLQLGMMLADRKEWPRAVRLLEIGTSHYPDSAHAWQSLGDAYRALKRSMPALQAYKRALKLQPQNRELAVDRMELTRDLHLTAELPSAYADVIKVDPDNLEAGSALADIRFQERNYSAAADLYGRVLQQKPDDKQAWVNDGYSLLELKRTPEAKHALQRALDLGVTDSRMLASLARIYQQEGDAAKAENLLNQMLAKDPKNPWAQYGLGQISEDRNQPGVAEDHYRKAFQLSPGNGEYAEALARMLVAKDACNEAIPVLEAARNSLSTDGKLMYGDCLLKGGRSDAALAQFNSVYAQTPTPAVLSKIADLQLSLGNVKEAMSVLQNASTPKDSNIQFSLAKVYLADHQPDKARSLLDGLIDKSEYNANYYYRRGMSWYESREWRKAQNDFSRALKYNDDLQDAAYYSGLCLLKRDEVSDAEDYFKELSVNRNPVWQAKGFLGIAMGFDAKHELEATENYLHKSLLAKETPEAAGMLSRVYMREHKTELAEKEARHALELNPDETEAVGVLSEALMIEGHATDALKSIKQALAKDPNSCDLNLSAAKVQYLAGNYESSQQSSRTAINNCPDEPGGYFFIATIAAHKYDKDQAKQYFRQFMKHGGDKKLVPEEYR